MKVGSSTHMHAKTRTPVYMYTYTHTHTPLGQMRLFPRYKLVTHYPCTAQISISKLHNTLEATHMPLLPTLLRGCMGTNDCF